MDIHNDEVYLTIYHSIHQHEFCCSADENANAILIVEFAKERVDRGVDITHATLQAVQLRLRPIVMTDRKSVV